MRDYQRDYYHPVSRKPTMYVHPLFWCIAVTLVLGFINWLLDFPN